jgi:hypothetical protein
MYKAIFDKYIMTKDCFYTPQYLLDLITKRGQHGRVGGSLAFGLEEHGSNLGVVEKSDQFLLCHYFQILIC